MISDKEFLQVLDQPVVLLLRKDIFHRVTFRREAVPSIGRWTGLIKRDLEESQHKASTLKWGSRHIRSKTVGDGGAKRLTGVWRERGESLTSLQESADKHPLGRVTAC